MPAVDDPSGAILQLETCLTLHIGYAIMNILTAINELMIFGKK
jgi:hypothetical protein